MARPPTRIRIPASHQEVLAELVTLPDDKFDRLAQALKEVPACPSEGVFADELAEKVDLEPDRLDEFTRLLGMLFRVREQLDLKGDEFLGEVERAARKTKKKSLLPPAVDWQKARTRIGVLLQAEATLGVTAKAVDLMAEHEKVYCSARVITDLRPIFSPDVTKEPTEILVVHNLRIGYHESGELCHTYFSMDASDLEDLQEMLERAVKKAKTLTSLAKRSGANVLEAVTHGD